MDSSHLPSLFVTQLHGSRGAKATFKELTNKFDKQQAGRLACLLSLAD